MTSFSVRLLLVPGKMPPPTEGGERKRVRMREGGREGGREGRTECPERLVVMHGRRLDDGDVLLACDREGRREGGKE